MSRPLSSVNRDKVFAAVVFGAPSNCVREGEGEVSCDEAGA